MNSVCLKVKDWVCDEKKLLWCILGGSFMLRVFGISNGLPNIFYSDEGHHVYWALNMGGDGFNPHSFFQPTLFFYLLFLVDAVFVAGGLLLGFFHVPGDAWVLLLRDKTPFFVIARMLSVLFGVLSVFLTYRLGRKVFNSKTGLMASFFLALSYLHVQYSQIAYIDVTLTFFIVLTVYCALTAYQSGRWRHFFITGLMAGLSFSIKYSGMILLILGPSILWIIAFNQKKVRFFHIFSDGRLWFFFLAFLIGFTLGTPYWLLDFKSFSRDFLTFVLWYKPEGVGQLGYEGRFNWFYYLSKPFWYGLGFPLEVLGLAGFSYFFFIRRRGLDWVLLVFPVVYFLILGKSDIRAARYVLPIIPFLCVVAAGFVSQVEAWWTKGRGLSKPAYLVMICFFVISPSIVTTVSYHFLQTAPDTRDLLHNWISSHIGPQEKFLTSFYSFAHTKEFPNSASLDEGLFDTRKNHLPEAKSLQVYRDEGYSYLIIDEWHEQTALNAERYNPLRKPASDCYRSLKESLEQTAHLVTEFSPYRNVTPAEFDQENVEFLSRGLWQRKSPGPRILIYKL